MDICSAKGRSCSMINWFNIISKTRTVFPTLFCWIGCSGSMSSRFGIGLTFYSSKVSGEPASIRIIINMIKLTDRALLLSTSCINLSLSFLRIVSLFCFGILLLDPYFFASRERFCIVFLRRFSFFSQFFVIVPTSKPPIAQ